MSDPTIQDPPTTPLPVEAPQAASFPAAPPFPLTYDVDYPDRPLDRLSTGLRFLWVIPIG